MKDKIREILDKTTALIGKSKGLNSLVEDGKLKREFKANGKTYVIHSADEVFNIEKSTAYENLQRQFSCGKTPLEQYASILERERILCEMSSKATRNEALSEMWRHTLNEKDSFKHQNGKYSLAFYIASLFIVEKGKNKFEPFTYEKADEKIKDWIAGNYKADDFFLLALSTSNECKKIIKG